MGKVTVSVINQTCSTMIRYKACIISFLSHLREVSLIDSVTMFVNLQILEYTISQTDTSLVVNVCQMLCCSTALHQDGHLYLLPAKWHYYGFQLSVTVSDSCFFFPVATFLCIFTGGQNQATKCRGYSQSTSIM